MAGATSGERSLQLPAKRLEHQLGQSVWRPPDYLGDNARQAIPLQYDSRLTDAGNYSEYHNPAVNRLIDRTLAEPHGVGRATRWAGIDQRIMRDASLVPLLWENFSFSWASTTCRALPSSGVQLCCWSRPMTEDPAAPLSFPPYPPIQVTST